MKVSIAMATFNGGKYLQEQLESLAAQTRLPDELVVCDDGSSDETVEILKRFATTAAIDTRIYRNPTNLGYSPNFGKAISLCSGDVIFISDQDDVWSTHKIERMLSEFGHSRPFWAAINDQWVADADLNQSGQTIFSLNRHFGLDDAELTAGSCTALSREFAKHCFPSPVPQIPYDSWIHAVAASLGTRSIVEEALQYYRRHGSNTSQPLVLHRSLLTKWVALAVIYGLQPMGEKHLEELALLGAVANVARTAASRGWVAADRAAHVLDVTAEKENLLKARLSICSMSRRNRPRLLLQLRSAHHQQYALGSVCKDMVRPRSLQKKFSSADAISRTTQ